MITSPIQSEEVIREYSALVTSEGFSIPNTSVIWLTGLITYIYENFGIMYCDRDLDDFIIHDEQKYTWYILRYGK